MPGPAVGLAIVAAAALVAWGALVWTAIGFGRSARGGEGGWAWLTVSSLAAVACLCCCLALGTAALRRLGVLAPPRDRRH